MLLVIIKKGEMDIGTTVIGIVIALLCALPILLSTLNNSRRKKKILQKLFNFAAQSNGKISQHGTCNNLSLGIDDTVHMIFFSKRTKDIEVFRQINLTEIKLCRVINSTRNVKHKDSNLYVVEKLELAFAYQDKNKKEFLIEFYNCVDDGQAFTGEVQFIEKWCKIINDKISTISKQL